MVGRYTRDGNAELRVIKRFKAKGVYGEKIREIGHRFYWPKCSIDEVSLEEVEQYLGHPPLINGAKYKLVDRIDGCYGKYSYIGDVYRYVLNGSSARLVNTKKRGFWSGGRTPPHHPDVFGNGKFELVELPSGKRVLSRDKEGNMNEVEFNVGDLVAFNEKGNPYWQGGVGQIKRLPKGDFAQVSIFYAPPNNVLYKGGELVSVSKGALKKIGDAEVPGAVSENKKLVEEKNPVPANISADVDDDIRRQMAIAAHTEVSMRAKLEAENLKKQLVSRTEANKALIQAIKEGTRIPLRERTDWVTVAVYCWAAAATIGAIIQAV